MRSPIFNLLIYIEMKKFCSILFVGVAVLISSCGDTKRVNEVSDTNCCDTASVSYEETYSPFVIRGVDMNSRAIKDGDFLWIGDLAQSDRADSSYQGITLPMTNAVVTAKKATIKNLAPDATIYVIDGETADIDAFNALEEKKIQRVTIDGDSLIIETRLNLEEQNPDLKIACDEEARLFQRANKK